MYVYIRMYGWLNALKSVGGYTRSKVVLSCHGWRV